jgi:bifunctional non-homologous end joining protein LigD
VPTRREDPLAEYRAKRDPRKTAEPVPSAGDPLPTGHDDTFVVQEHHTPRGRTGERVHWDLRLERDGVLKSWAVPKGPPTRSSTGRSAARSPPASTAAVR